MSKENAVELPAGWKREELRFESRYVYQDGEAMVRVQKAETSDPYRLDVCVYGFVSWSGYVGETTGYKPLGDALKMAEETLANPRSHLSEYGVQKVEEAKGRYLAEMARRLDVNKLPPAVRSALRERGHSDQVIAIMSPREAFDEYCMWNGIVNWGDTLWENAKALMAFEPKPSPAAAPFPQTMSPAALAEKQGFGDPTKVVVMMSGGVVEDVLVSGKGISVAVVEHDKNADLDHQIAVPDEDGEEGYALASIREPVVNPGRVDELFAAVEEARPAAECEGALRP
ncbi:MAG: hypothetical protein KAX55_00440 [Propionivibrio sp.]|nr:hypothetical protein [Propionivibrio sp.]